MTNATDITNYSIQEITGDNRRPGMEHQTGSLVRYNPHESYGWLCCRTFATPGEAEAFAKTLTKVETIEAPQVAKKIEASRVTERDRLSFLPKHFGKLMMKFEGTVYLWIRRLSTDYTGGSWNFYELSNGGFYMAPSCDKQFQFDSPNYAQEEVSADAAGVIVTMFALNAIINGIACEEESDLSENFIKGYYLLRDFAAEHAENRKIFAIID